MGERLFAGLRRDRAPRIREVITEVRGRGLMAGVQYAEDSIGPRMSYHLARHGVLAIYSGNQPSVMRLMPALVIEEDEVDFLLDGARRGRSRTCVSGAGPEESAPDAAPAPAGAADRDHGELRATADGGLGRAGGGARRLHGQLQRQRAAAQDAARLVADAALRLLGHRHDLLDGGATTARSSSTPEGHVGTPDIVVTTDSETFCDMFWGDLNPVQKYLRGEITVKGSQEDVMRLDAISFVIWPDA